MAASLVGFINNYKWRQWQRKVPEPVKHANLINAHEARRHVETVINRDAQPEDVRTLFPRLTSDGECAATNCTPAVKQRRGEGARSSFTGMEDGPRPYEIIVAR